MTSAGKAALGIAGLAALVGLGWIIERHDPRALLVTDNPRRRRRRRRRSTSATVEAAIARCERQAAAAARPTTFRRKREAVRALLDANPDLRQLVDSDCGADCRAFDEWTRRGRRGPKPRARAGDGRFDPLNEQWERRTPGRKVASWKEALAVTAPTSRRWGDFADRLPVLEDATGLRLNLPDRAEAVEQARIFAERCRDIEDATGGTVVPLVPF